MKLLATVKNIPPETEKYIVARLDNAELWYWGSWENRKEAEKITRNFGNAVLVERED